MTAESTNRAMTETHNPMIQTPGVLVEVLAERIRQHGIWGTQNHPLGTGPDVMVMGRRAADWESLLRTECDTAARGGVVTMRHILLEEIFEALAERDPERIREELVQSAAVIAMIVECIDRRPRVDFMKRPRCPGCGHDEHRGFCRELIMPGAPGDVDECGCLDNRTLYECGRCKDTGVDPEDSDPGAGPSEYSMGEPPAIEPCRNCGPGSAGIDPFGG